MTVTVPNDYPFKPPSMIFTSPIYHFITRADRSTLTIKYTLDHHRPEWTPHYAIPMLCTRLHTWLTTPLDDIDMTHLCGCRACFNSVPKEIVMNNRA
eukprot:10994-Heterococcus_DN1.PRE.1